MKHTYNIFDDERGSFMPIPLEDNWLQANISYSNKGVIRGMHQQQEPFNQAKKIIVLEGIINDVIYNPKDKIIKSYILSKGESIIVPNTFFHGYESLEDSIIMYLIDKPYTPTKELIINPLTFGFRWLTDEPIMSEKDKYGITRN